MANRLPKSLRCKRAKKTRAVIASHGATRLTIYRSSKHIYAQVFLPDGSEVLASASTLEKGISETVRNTGNIEAAALVGKTVAERALKIGIISVAFDRSGYLYHGRVKALAEAARAAGLTI